MESDKAELDIVAKKNVIAQKDEIPEKETAQKSAMEHAAALKKVYSLLGLSQRGGHMASGEFMTEKAVKGGKAFLCIVAEDSSDNTKKMFQNMCEYYHVPFCCFSDKNTLGHQIGKEFRASLAVLDAGLAKAVKGHFATLGITVRN